MCATPAHPRSQVKLVISDVDSTLLTHDKVLTDKAKAAVKKIRDAGIGFTITSSRPPRGMKMLIDGLKLSDPIGAFNGGLICNPDFSPVSEILLSRELAAKTISIIAQHHLDVWVYTSQDWYVQDATVPHARHEAQVVQFEPVAAASFDGLLDKTIKIVGVSDDPAAVVRCEKAVREACGPEVSATRSQPYYLDVTNSMANKGEVVRQFSRMRGISVAEVATIGDGSNDVLMFRVSGMSIAMGNAAPEVQAAATFVTSSNEEEGFASAMEKFILPRGPSHIATPD